MGCCSSSDQQIPAADRLSPPSAQHRNDEVMYTSNTHQSQKPNPTTMYPGAAAPPHSYQNNSNAFTPGFQQQQQDQNQQQRFVQPVNQAQQQQQQQSRESPEKTHAEERERFEKLEATERNILLAEENHQFSTAIVLGELADVYAVLLQRTVETDEPRRRKEIESEAFFVLEQGCRRVTNVLDAEKYVKHAVEITQQDSTLTNKEALNVEFIRYSGKLDVSKYVHKTLDALLPHVVFPSSASLFPLEQLEFTNLDSNPDIFQGKHLRLLSCSKTLTSLHLEEISSSNFSWFEIEFKYFPQMTALSDLYIASSNAFQLVTESVDEYLRATPSLKKLTILMGGANDSTQRVQVAAFCKGLCSSTHEVGNAGSGVVVEATPLEHLELSWSAALIVYHNTQEAEAEGDNCMLWLSKLRNLKSLKIDGSFTDEGLKQFCCGTTVSKTLETLDLSLYNNNNTSINNLEANPISRTGYQYVKEELKSLKKFVPPRSISDRDGSVELLMPPASEEQQQPIQELELFDTCNLTQEYFSSHICHLLLRTTRYSSSLGLSKLVLNCVSSWVIGVDEAAAIGSCRSLKYLELRFQKFESREALRGILNPKEANLEALCLERISISSQQQEEQATRHLHVNEQDSNNNTGFLFEKNGADEVTINLPNLTQLELVRINESDNKSLLLLDGYSLATLLKHLPSLQSLALRNIEDLSHLVSAAALEPNMMPKTTKLKNVDLSANTESDVKKVVQLMSQIASSTLETLELNSCPNLRDNVLECITREHFPALRSLSFSGSFYVNDAGLKKLYRRRKDDGNDNNNTDGLQSIRIGEGCCCITSAGLYELVMENIASLTELDISDVENVLPSVKGLMAHKMEVMRRKKQSEVSAAGEDECEDKFVKLEPADLEEYAW